MISRVFAFAACIAWSAIAGSQTVAISGATVHTVGPAGTLEDATVLVENGVITGVGTNINVPAGIERIDGSGKIVTPGIVSPAGQLGLVEVGAVSGTVDSVQRGEIYAAGFDIADAFNRRSTLIAITRSEGVTRAVITPLAANPDELGNQSHVFSGLASVMQLGDTGDPVMRRGVAVVANLGENGSSVAAGSRAGALMILRTALDDAIDYANNRAAFDRGDWREYSISRADLEALQGVLNKTRKLLVRINRASDIEALLGIASSYGVDVVILGGAEAWMVAGQLATSGTPVILDATNNLPGNFDKLNARLESGALLSQAGVQVSYGAGSANQNHNARNLTQAAGIAVANGLSWDVALAAITLQPARMFGVADRVGSIEVGKDGDLVIWPDDPLELTNFPERVFVRGAAIDMTSRQTRLRDRYLQPDNGKPPAFRN